MSNLDEMESLKIGDDSLQVWVLPLEEFLQMNLGEQLASIVYSEEGTTVHLNTERLKVLGLSELVVTEKLEGCSAQNALESLRLLAEQRQLSRKEEVALECAAAIQVSAEMHPDPVRRSHFAKAISEATLFYHLLRETAL